MSADAAYTTATLLPTPVLAALAGSLLDELAADGWDQPPKLYGIVAGDQLAELAAHHPGLGELTVTAEYTQLSIGLVEVAEFDDHPYSQLRGYTAPDDLAALVVVSEGWASSASFDTGMPSDPDDPAGLLHGGRRGPDGRVEVRMLELVTRAGAAVSAFDVRDGDRQVNTRDLFDPVDPVRDSAGRISGALHRAFGLPAPPPPVPPWPALAELWGELAASVIRTERDRTPPADLDETLAQLTIRRPDLAAVASLGRAARVAQYLTVELGIGPDDVARLDGSQLSGRITDPQQRRGLLEATNPAADLLWLPVGSERFLARLDEHTRAARATIAQLGWDAVTGAALDHRLAFASPDQRQQLLDVPDSWWDPPTALLELQGLTDPSRFSLCPDLRRLAGLSGVPRWFRAAASDLREWAASVQLPARPGS